MSSGAVRSQMTMRATIQRDANAQTGATKDALGGQLAPSFADLSTTPTPCFAWSKGSRRVLNGANETVLIKDDRAIVPRGTDVTERDRIFVIKDRAGTVLFTGPFAIDAVEPRADHLELALRRIH